MGAYILCLVAVVVTWLIGHNQKIDAAKRYEQTLGGLLPAITKYTCSACGSTFSAPEVKLAPELRTFLICACCGADHSRIAKELGKPIPPDPFLNLASYDPEGRKINAERPDLPSLAKAVLRAPENQSDFARRWVERGSTPEQFASTMTTILEKALTSK